MRYDQALEEMRHGKSVRRKEWPAGRSLSITNSPPPDPRITHDGGWFLVISEPNKPDTVWDVGTSTDTEIYAVDWEITS